MIGPVVLGAALLYLLISIAVVRWAIRYARNNGRSAKRWGWGAALVMYLIPFWDWIPTVAVHQYYCSTEAGFWVYKTVDQWKVENPGVIEKLVANKLPVLISHEGDRNIWTDVEMLNQRIKIVSKHSGPLFLHRWRWEGEWVDSKNNEVLARYVDFYTSYERREAGWSGWKFWMASEHCPGYQDQASQFSKAIEEFKGAKK